MEAANDGLLPPVGVDREASVADLWRARLGQVLRETYAGLPLVKFAEDLRVYERLLWSARVDVVIEIGTFVGGSALWFRDRLRAMRAYRLPAAPGDGAPLVISIDIDLSRARQALGELDAAYDREILLLEGDVTDLSLAAEVGRLIPAGARCLVVDDGPHTHAGTSAALRGFAPFVSPGSWFVAEDGVVDEDELRVSADWPRGVQQAVMEWLDTPAGGEFTLERDAESYAITTNCHGYLRRRA